MRSLANRRFLSHQTEKRLRLDGCRTGAFFYRQVTTGAVRVGAQSCHLRFCPLCSRTKILTVKQNVTRWLEKAKYPKILTFTLKHSDQSLTDQLNKLYSSFQKIRRLNIMKKNCTGGVWFFQVKKSKSDNLWHPHIHCLVAGKYMHQSELKQKWFHITGDSLIVDIRPIKDKAITARYVARYAASPCNLQPLDFDECIEVAVALESRRICGTWGICRKLKITSPPKPDTVGWYKLASWNCIYSNKDIDKNAKAIIDAWRKGTELPKEITVDHLYGESSTYSQSSERASPEIEYQSWFCWRYEK